MAFATWANYFGEPELALDAIRGTNRDVQLLLVFHFLVPFFADMRGLPGFKEIVNDIGLVEYWREDAWSDFCEVDGDADFVCN
jgi:hypothetical protein